MPGSAIGVGGTCSSQGTDLSMSVCKLVLQTKTARLFDTLSLMQHSDIKQLLDAWSDVLMRQRASLDRDDPADQSANIAVDGMSWGAVFHQCVEADLKL